MDVRPESGEPFRRVIAVDAVNMSLDESSHPGLWVDGGWPVARTAEIARFGDVGVGIWEITSGVVSDIENDECFFVLSGVAQIRFEDGEVVVLAPGTCVRLKAGDRTEWTVISTLRTLTITSPSG